VTIAKHKEKIHPDKVFAMISFNDTSSYRSKLRRKETDERILKIGQLKPMPKMQILCSKSSGLPFDCLMTDVMSGYLNLGNICYGNCTAADYWIKQGFDFGKRTLNDKDFLLQNHLLSPI
jgi:hypothetical protein